MSRSNGIPAILALICSILIFLSQSRFDRFLKGENDFGPLYAGARLSGTDGLYSVEANEAVQKEIFGNQLQLGAHFSRPAFYALLLRPLGFLPYRVAYWIFQTLSLAAFVTFLWIWSRRVKELLLFAAFSMPLLLDVLMGQDITFTLLLAALAVEATRRRLDLVAGIVFSLCTIKAHFFVLIPIVLWVAGRRKTVLGGVIGGGSLFAISLVTDGLSWPARYLHLLTNPVLHPNPDVMPTIRGLAFALTGAEHIWLQATVAAAVIAAVCWAATKLPLEDSLAVAIAGGLLVSWHAYLSDCVLLFLPFVIALERSRGFATRCTAALMAGPVVYLVMFAGRPWSAAVPLSMVLFIAASIKDMLALQKHSFARAAIGADVVAIEERGK